MTVSMKASAMALTATMALSASSAMASQDLMGNWITKKVECQSPQGASAPEHKVNLNLNVAQTTFTAVGTLGNKSCTVKGTYTYNSGVITFNVTDDGGCPLGNRRNAAFEARLNGREATVTLGGAAPALLCKPDAQSVEILMEKK